ncbi:MAG TPA: porphobilinogen synthase [Nitrososphaeraceae archaeon]|jgi:porphobilinogen synthase|nr:porphobilinogen synthase [Nitrososphaeraceae archaeon]
MLSFDNDIYYEFSKQFNLKKSDLIFPLFVNENKNSFQELSYMPGIFKISYDEIIQIVEKIVDQGIISLLLFGIPRLRDNMGKSSFSKNGIIQNSLQLIKSNFGNKITVITDVCVCQYNKTGHCGLLLEKNDKKEVVVNNDLTIELLSKIALSHASAGADIVAPSSMMDGQVRKLRETLDSNGYNNIKILSFSAKQSSSLYKPFRSETFFDTASANEIDKSTYQVSYNNPRQIQREIEMDIYEGSDMVLIKPAISSLDLVYRIKKFCKIPIVVQIVSGEYSMIKAASEIGVLDEIYFILNLIYSLKRVGVDKIISYSSFDISKYLL